MAAAASASASTPQGVAERRGIPAAAFVEDVEAYLRQAGLDVNSALAFLQESSLLFLLVIHSCLILMNGDALEYRVFGAIEFTSHFGLQQYKIVEMKLLAQQRDLQAKIPDIEKCLDIVAALQAKKALGEALIADFELSEGIYSRAKIEDTDSVCLWLGANVMLEYSCDEANDLLKKNLENAKASLEVLVADLQFLRDQQTITQVTIARVFNWDVHQRRSKQAVKET
ncbi:hypothetical protein U9M48_037035 [Paspalum notatum var. saurae]|uniref:Prefoldin subunit 3 n=1 Tax=Paspalum notatum var. saurae TaxID=547442 RepID=A0AAQ3UE64_PASNO